MKNLKINITKNLKSQLITQGLDELEGKENWICYINESFSLYQGEELMRATYAEQRKLKALQKITHKTAIEMQEEKALSEKLALESPGTKLFKMAADRQFFVQRKLLSSQSESAKQSQSVWALWMRFSQFLNEKLSSIGEQAVIDKREIESIQRESEDFIFDHPQQLLADLSFLDEMTDELTAGIESAARLSSKEADSYRQELNRVLNLAKSERFKIKNTLVSIKEWMSAGNTKNITHRTKDKIEKVFEKAIHLPTEKWSAKELSILDEIKVTSEKVFPSKIMTKPVYTLKDYVDICHVTSPEPGFALNTDIPLEIEKIPSEKSSFFSFFHQGQDALFDLFSNQKVNALDRAYQDLEALQTLSLQNPELIEVITQELSLYRDKFMNIFTDHKSAVEKKIQSLTADFISRLIAEKEIIELKNWLSTLNRFYFQAEDIIQKLYLNSMSHIPKSLEKVEETKKLDAEKNLMLEGETQRLIKESQRLHTVSQAVFSENHAAFSTTLIETAKKENSENTKSTKSSESTDRTESSKNIENTEKTKMKSEVKAEAETETEAEKNELVKNSVPQPALEVFSGNQEIKNPDQKLIPPPKPPKRIPANYTPVKSAIAEGEGVGVAEDTTRAEQSDAQLTPRQKRDAALKACAESEGVNKALGEETQRLAQNLQALKEKRQRLMAHDAQTESTVFEKVHAVEKALLTLKPEPTPSTKSTPVTQPVFTKDFSKALASVCVARGDAMKKSQEFSTEPEVKPVEAKDSEKTTSEIIKPK